MRMNQNRIDPALMYHAGARSASPVPLAATLALPADSEAILKACSRVTFNSLVTYSDDSECKQYE